MAGKNDRDDPSSDYQSEFVTYVADQTEASTDTDLSVTGFDTGGTYPYIYLTPSRSAGKNRIAVINRYETGSGGGVGPFPISDDNGIVWVNLFCLIDNVWVSVQQSDIQPNQLLDFGGLREGIYKVVITGFSATAATTTIPVGACTLLVSKSVAVNPPLDAPAGSI